MSETALLRNLLLAVSNAGARVFRNNVGIGWAGGPIVKVQRPTTMHLVQGDVVVHNARPLHSGLCEGSSDAIGWRSIEITAEMVGRRVAVFVSIEAKSDTGRLTAEQKHFLETVSEAGGIALVVQGEESIDWAAQIVKGWPLRVSQ